MIHPSIRRETASLTAFMNALWREWPHAAMIGSNAHDLAGPAGALRLPLTRPGGALIVPLCHYSPAGRHRFTGELHFISFNDEAFELDFAQAVALLAGEPTLAPGTSDNARRLFLRRVLDSANTLLAAETSRQQDMQALAWPAADYLAAEQGLIYGHAVHPTPKSRDEFTPEDLRRYSPEMAGSTPLAWMALKGAALWHTDVGMATAQDQLNALIASDPALAPMAQAYPRADGWSLLPVHPWQAHVIRQTQAYRYWHQQGDLIDLGEAGASWFPTSSLRAMYAAHAPAQLKFSLSVRLTNSRRVLQPTEVARGRLIHGAFASRLGRQLQERCPTLGILHETAALALATPAGEPLAESFVIFRDNPFPAGTTAYVMATFCQDGVAGAPSMVARLIQDLAHASGEPLATVAAAWFDRFLEVALKPFLIAQADYGFLFSAHQQNTVLALEGGWPAGMWFRDCQGTTFRAETIAALAGEVPGIQAASELAFDEPMTNQLFGYYLIVNNVLNLVATLGGDGIASEAELSRQLHAFLQGLRREPLRYPHFIDFLLNSPEIMGKGNFMICFGDINETTQPEGSFRSYVPIHNPICSAGLA
ncbi:aerobactin siderophore biosynthesis protein IucA [Chitinimonas prasina]|uniref:Aerobactin siderophore biosynthesis protein IucA n=1 Tax=Chitinimonas prasina TaxID=1434937 RepID=A0ABQ5YCL3_9NEIS|nr:IucA/IucC family protein [Chitinimonas prasina]GLR12223.1 aerobactin siderophore biosynthesis protein IucA [Chitinimonas prasina]